MRFSAFLEVLNYEIFGKTLIFVVKNKRNDYESI